MIKYFTDCWNSTLKEKSIPSLDGLRAISIFFVIGGHVYLTQNHGPQTKFFIYQDLGGIVSANMHDILKFF